MSKVPYVSTVGSLMYVMLSSRPDIVQTVGVLSRFMSKLERMHWEAIKWILRYLKITTNMALSFGGNKVQLQSYVDSDLSENKNKSTTRYVFTLGDTAISWMSQLQKIVVFSSTEKEYIVATNTIKELIWLKTLMDELGKK